jgi:hypothetical protein
MFLYSQTGLYHKAYFITPDDAGDDIHHQYGCVGCSQFEIKGRLEKVPDDLAQKFDELLARCDYAKAEVISLETGMEVDYVLGEGLLKLADGRYVATCNCD